MKRLLLVLCWLVAAREADARRSAVQFDLSLCGRARQYVLVLGTPAEPRRFIFDTGTTATCVSESLRGELGAWIVETFITSGFDGYVIPIDLVRLDCLRMGDALFGNHPVLVMPDKSRLFACRRVDGIAGCGLLRRFAGRLPNADSKITLASDVLQVDPSAVVRGEIRGDKPEVTVERKEGTRVMVPLKKLK